jgi:hypothetical protein
VRDLFCEPIFHRGPGLLDPADPPGSNLFDVTGLDLRDGVACAFFSMPAAIHAVSGRAR